VGRGDLGEQLPAVLVQADLGAARVIGAGVLLTGEGPETFAAGGLTLI
jgi:hypothetical protein